FAVPLFAAVLVGGWGITVRGPDEARCAFCRYPVAALPAPICPECGRDLRGSGTIGPGRRVWQPPRLLAVLCRTVLVAIPVTFVTAWLVSERPCTLSLAHAQATSATGLVRSIDVYAWGSGVRTTTLHGASVVPLP